MKRKARFLISNHHEIRLNYAMMSLLALGVLSKVSASDLPPKHQKNRFELHSTAQEKVNIKGRVFDENSVPAANVVIRVKGTNIATQTNNKGEFTLQNINKGSTLVFSRIDLVSVEKAATDGMTIVMTSDTKTLAEAQVVNIGYGTQKKRTSTAATSRIEGEQLQNRPGATIESLLQGLAPGLVVQNNSGSPGGRSSVTVRGLAAFSSSANSNVVSSPLFVIDGIPMEQDVFNPSDPRQSVTSVLAGFSPFDIESVDVLKDASATAIYGSRGANGVIIVTTKRGKAGKPVVTLNTQFGVSYFPNLRPTLGGKAERDFKIKLYNQYKESKVGGGFTDLPIELSDSLNTFYNNSTNWQDLYFRNATFKNANLGISGATDNTSYRISGDFYDEKGTVVGSGFKRYALTFYGSYRPMTNLNVVARANLNQTDASKRRGADADVAVVGNNFSSSLIPDPKSGYYDTFLESYNKGVNIDLKNSVLAQLEATYDIFDFLSLTTRASANYQFRRTRNFSPSGTNVNNKASADYYSKETADLLSETFLRYHQTFNEAHTLDFMVGNSINTNTQDNIYGSAFGGPSDSQQVIKGYPQANIYLQTGNIKYGLLSYYSRLTYDYKQKYLFQTAMRADASSKFGKDNQWGYFPSVSAGWVFTKENFLKDWSADWFNFGKFRASWGKSGSQYDDNYLALGAFVSSGSTYDGIPILTPNYGGANGIPLPNLTWQTAETKGLGLDLEFFKSRLTATLDYYTKITDNFLFEDPLNSTSGYSKRYINGGAVKNTGYEAAITAYVTNPESKFQYTTTLIMGTNKNILTKLPDFGRSISRTGGPESPYLQIGKSLNGYYLFKYLGVYATEDDVPVNKYTGKKLFPNTSGFASQDTYHAGDIALADIDQDGSINVLGTGDRVYSGDPNPKVTGSWANNFQYKFANNSSISLNLFFTYSLGAKVYNKVLSDRLKSVSWTGSKNVNYPGGQSNLLDVSDLDYWTPDHINAKYPALNPWRYYSQSSYDFIGNYDVDTDLFLENGNFVRLKTLSIGYDFSPDILRKVKIRRLRVFGTLDNVFIIKKYTGVDPENVTNFGYDKGDGYPIPKRFNLGFNFEF